MVEHLDKVIVLGLIVMAVVTAWAVLTPNSLFIG